MTPVPPALTPVPPALTPAAPALTLAAVVTGLCQGCGACLLTCPEHAIRPGHAGTGDAHGSRRLIVLETPCTGCGECVEVCPVDAIDLVGMAGTTRRGEHR